MASIKGESISLISPSSLFSAILRSEKRQWDEHKVNVVSKSVSDVKDQLKDITLIRHGRLLDTVHGFFYMLEKQHACTQLSSLGRTENQIRVNPEDYLNESAAGEESRSSGRTVILQAQEQAVYRCALMCAQFPVLSAPSPPEDDTPLPSHTSTASPTPVGSVHTERGTFTEPTVPEKMRRGNKLYSQSYIQEVKPIPSSGPGGHPRSESGVESLLQSPPPHGHEMYDHLVNRDMLCTLVRKAFKQSEEEHLRLEQQLLQELGGKSKGKVLVKELVSQLMVLENNGHPFYRPKLFLQSRNGYELWLGNEKKRIKQLIEKFWHYSLPPPSTWVQYNPIDFHKAYALLAEKVLQFDLDTLYHTVCGSRDVLTPQSRRLLREFSQRYGVGILYCQIVYIDLLSRKFDYNIHFLQQLMEAIIELRKLIPYGRNRLMVRQEFDILKGAIRLLRNHCEYSFTRIERLFLDADPQDGVGTLIKLYQEIVNVEKEILGKHPDPLEKSLKKYLKSGFLNTYERKKVSLEHLAQQNHSYTDRLSPELIHSLIVSLKDELKHYRKFKELFFNSAGFDIESVGKVEFYKRLNKDASDLSIRVISQRESRERVSLPMLALMYRLNELDMTWRLYISSDLQTTWRKPFTELILIWMDVISKKFNEWVLQSLDIEEWTILKIDCKDSNMTNHVPRGRSASAVSMVPSENSAFAGVSHGNLASASLSSMSSASPRLSSSLPRNLQISLEHHPEVRKGKDPSFNPHQSGIQSDSCLDFSQRKVPLYPPSQGVFSSVERRLQNDRLGEGNSNQLEAALPIESASGTTQISPVHDMEVSPPPVPKLSPYSPVIPVSPAAMPTRPQASPVAMPTRPQASPVAMPTRPRASPVAMPTRPRASPVAMPTRPRASPVAMPTRPQASPAAMPTRPRASPVAMPTRPQASPAAMPTRPRASPVAMPTRPRVSPAVMPPPIDVNVIPKISPSPFETETTDAYLRTQSSLDLESTISDKTDVSLFQHSGTWHCNKCPAILPVSNSVFDLIVMFSRFASFLSTLQGKVVSSVVTRPDIEAISSPTERQNKIQFSNWVVAARKNLHGKFIKIMCQAIKLYTDNLLCMDVCGFPSEDAMTLLGAELFFHLKNRKEANEIWGCRHDNDHRSMNSRLAAHSKCQSPSQSEYEIPRANTCLRMNNIAMFKEITPRLAGHFSDALSKGLNESFESQIPPSESQEIQQLTSYLLRIQTVQMHLTCVKMNYFTSEVLGLVTKLSLPNYSTEKRLKPLTDFINIQQKLFHQFLLPSLAEEMIYMMWIYIVKDLETHSLKLFNFRKSDIQHSSLLLDILQTLIRFMEKIGKVNGENLIKSTTFLLTLLNYYQKPQAKLLNMFHMLNTNRNHTKTGNFQILKAIKSRLLSVKKSFNGKDFLEAYSHSACIPESNYSDSQDVAIIDVMTTDPDAVIFAKSLLAQEILLPMNQNGFTISTGSDQHFHLDRLYRFMETDELLEHRQVDLSHFQVCHSASRLLTGTESMLSNHDHSEDDVQMAKLHTMSFLMAILAQRGFNTSELHDQVGDPLEDTNALTSLICL